MTIFEEKKSKQSPYPSRKSGEKPAVKVHEKISHEVTQRDTKEKKSA